jgi:hypothetical protein
MDRDLYKLWCFLGIAVALAAFFPLGAKRRACVLPVVWWVCLILGGVTCIYGLTHATAPSFATRITAIGRTYDYVERTAGTWPYEDTLHGFRFVPDGGEPVNIETEIILPGWGDRSRDFRWSHISRCVPSRQQTNREKRSNRHSNPVGQRCRVP